MNDPKKDEFRCGDSGDETSFDAVEQPVRDDYSALRKLNDRKNSDDFPERD